MNCKTKLSLITAAVLTGLLTGCGDAETTIIEKDPIIIEPGHDDDHGHNHGNDITIESLGRIAVLSEQDMSVTLLDIDDGAELDHFAVANEGSALHPSASFRYAVVASRTAGTVEFIDGGLWREDHQEHLHDFEQAPRTSSYSLSGTRPTHISSHDGKMAIFYDGDSDAGLPASVHLISDADITTSNSNPAAIDYTVNMHGVAKPGDDVVLATFRRDDSESTSGNVILPDQVAVYHKHDGEFEQEQVLSTLCPDLHGAAVNHEFFVFGCGDGVLAAHAHDDEFESMKIANIDAIDGMRIGTLYGHEDSELFFGIASNRATGERVFVSVNPESSSMEAIEWESNAAPVSYTFNYHGDKFIILDDQGVISKFEIHEHEGEMEFEFDGSLKISEQDLTTMPEGHSFAMAASQKDDHIYVADPIAQHVLRVDIDEMSIEGDMELDVTPSKLIWLGIKEEGEDDHGHSHD